MSRYIPVRERLTSRLPSPYLLRIEPERIPQAAVTLLLREVEGDDLVLIIKRAERLGDPWSGHLALPGGRVEEQDEDLLITAARETREEVGIDLLGMDLLDGMVSRQNFIGQLPTLTPASPGLPPIEITPLVALTPPDQSLQPNDEVGDLYWLSISELLANGRSSEYRLNLGSYVRKWPAYPSPGGPIWGITERILTSFLTLLD